MEETQTKNEESNEHLHCMACETVKLELSHQEEAGIKHFTTLITTYSMSFQYVLQLRRVDTQDIV